MEKERIQQSAECCRRILNHVNEEVKVMENLLVRRRPPQLRWSSCQAPSRAPKASAVSHHVCPQTLKEYQRKLDTSGLKPSNDLYTEYKVRRRSRPARFPSSRRFEHLCCSSELQNVDLTQKKMLYEGPVTWRVTKEKAIGTLDAASRPEENSFSFSLNWPPGRHGADVFVEAFGLLYFISCVAKSKRNAITADCVSSRENRAGSIEHEGRF